VGIISFIKNLFKNEADVENEQGPELAIAFPDQQLIGETGVNFPATINGRRVSCEITFEALQDRFHVLNNDFLNGYHANRNQIQELARRLIRANPGRGRFIITTNQP
jgi:hypothetical protein